VPKDFLLDEERAEQEGDVQQKPKETIVAPSHDPSDTPLPLLFRRDDILRRAAMIKVQCHIPRRAIPEKDGGKSQHSRLFSESRISGPDRNLNV
jgi:hypothetical protein